MRSRSRLYNGQKLPLYNRARVESSAVIIWKASVRVLCTKNGLTFWEHASAAWLIDQTVASEQDAMLCWRPKTYRRTRSNSIKERKETKNEKKRRNNISKHRQEQHLKSAFSDDEMEERWIWSPSVDETSRVPDHLSRQPPIESRGLPSGCETWFLYFLAPFYYLKGDYYIKREADWKCPK